MSSPPTAPPDVQRLGQTLYRDLALCLSSHAEWFGEGYPAEWLRALDALDKHVRSATRRAKAALAQTAPAQQTLL